MKSTKILLLFLILYLTLVEKIECHQNKRQRRIQAETDGHDDEHEDHNDFTNGEIWLYTVLSTVMMGVIGFLSGGIVVLFKKYTKVNFKPVIGILLAFAAGALIGDAFVHLIPVGFGIHGHGDEAHTDDHDEEGADEHHDDEGEEHTEEKPNIQILSLMIILGIVTFFIIEKIFHALGVGHSHGPKEQQEHIHQLHMQEGLENENAHNRLQGVNDVKLSENIDLDQEKQLNQVNNSNNIVLQIDSKEQINSDKAKQGQIEVLNKMEQDLEEAKTNKGSDEQTEEEENKKSWKGKRPEGYLNLLGDGLHNILDGIAIGAIFASGNSSLAVSTLIAVIAHEIPQEIGDISITLHSKFSNFQALFCNSIVQLTAVIGGIIGVAIGSIDEASTQRFTCFIAGNFLYIAMSDMFPLMAQEKSIKMGIAQFLALSLGIGIMYLILLVEDDGH